ncbi:MAG: biotin synthase BioB [Firmicutes bacterium]|nr:biotin synthase BioB [Bacillota bacterium]
MDMLIKTVADKVLAGSGISFDEAVALAQTDDLEEFLSAANRIRSTFKGDRIDLCAIMNAKSGKCSENCKFCAQSGHYVTNIAEYPLVEVEEAVALAKKNEAQGVRRFGIVTSGKAVSAKDFEKIVAMVKVLRQETHLEICASLGCITYGQAARLKAAGLSRYHHNVETSSDFFAQICDTHNYQDRIGAIQSVSRTGMEVCCGGIIGLGENMAQRIKMAFEIKALGIKSVPLNILNPIPGTPFADKRRLPPEEILRSIAIFRFILPEADLRYAGGRNALGQFQRAGLKAGISAAMVGDFLTTTGNKIADDLMMFKEEGFEF